MLKNTIQQLKTDQSHSNRYHLLLSLSNTIDEKLVDVYRDMLLNEDEKDYIKFQAVSNLSKYPDEVIADLLPKAYAENSDEELKNEIVNVMKNIKPRLSIDFFIDNLGETIDNLREQIWKAVSGNLNPQIINLLINRVEKFGNHQQTETILKFFIENGNTSIARRILGKIKIKDRPASVLVQLFKLLKCYDPFQDENERIRTFQDIFFTVKSSPGYINYTEDIRELESHIESIGGTTNKAELLSEEATLNPTIEFLDTDDCFLLNGRKIFVHKASIDALKILSQNKGQYINNEKYAELIDPYGERNVGARALTTAISSLKKAIKKYYPEFIFDSLIGQKYGRGYYVYKSISISKTKKSNKLYEGDK